MSDTDMFSSCPFCGSTDLRIVHMSSGVRCNGCMLEVVLAPGAIRGGRNDRLIALATRWNQRKG